jgi:hypothetical protein
MMERLEEHTGGVSCSTEHQMVDSLGPEFLDLSQTVADIRQVLFANTLFFLWGYWISLFGEITSWS